MEFELITFDEARSLINDILEYQPEDHYELIPNEIFCMIEKAGITLEGKQIPKWSEFESENGYYPIGLFLRSTKIQLKTREPIIIISDECFKTQKAYKVPSNRLLKFAENIYPKIHNMDLVQPLDLIFIQPSTKTISMIHHEGIIMEYVTDENHILD